MNIQPLIDQFRSVVGGTDPRLQELQAAADTINAAADQAAWEEAVKRFQQVALSIVTSYTGEALPSAIPGVAELRKELEQLRQNFDQRRDDLHKQLTFGPLTLDVDLPLAMATFEQPAGPPVALPLGLLPPTGFGVSLDAGAALARRPLEPTGRAGPPDRALDRAGAGVAAGPALRAGAPERRHAGALGAASPPTAALTADERAAVRCDGTVSVAE